MLNIPSSGCYLTLSYLITMPTQIWFNEQGRKWNSSKIKMENKDLLSAPLKRKHCWILSLTVEKKDWILCRQWQVSKVNENVTDRGLVWEISHTYKASNSYKLLLRQASTLFPFKFNIIPIVPHLFVLGLTYSVSFKKSCRYQKRISFQWCFTFLMSNLSASLSLDLFLTNKVKPKWDFPRDYHYLYHHLYNQASTMHITLIWWDMQKAIMSACCVIKIPF